MQDLPGRRKALIMSGVMLGMFVTSINQTVVSTAMPRVIASLGGLDLFSWVFTAYMLTSTTTIPIYGKLSDLFGRKNLYLFALSIFMLGSILGGLSQSMEQLIAFRAVQGLGFGGIMALSFTIIGDLFSPAERGRWQGLNSAVFGLSAVLGPLIGGYITDNLSWRWVFYVNVPFGIVAMFMLAAVLPRVTERSKASVDYRGAALLGAALVPLLLGLVWGGTEYEWGSPVIIGLFGISVAATIALLANERAADEPILPLELFRNRSVSVSAGATFLTGLAMFSVITYIPLFVQGVIGSSATRSGLVTMPLMLSMMTMSAVTGQIMSRTGRYLYMALAGTAVMAAGVFMMSRLGPDATNGQAQVAMVVIGLGLGPTMPIFLIAVQNAVPYRYMGVVTSNIQFFRQIGGTVGVAIMGSVLNNRLASDLSTSLPARVRDEGSPQLLDAVQNPQILLDEGATARVRVAFDQFGADGAALFTESFEAIRVALADALDTIFFLTTFAVIAGFLVTLLLREVPLRSRDEIMEEIAEMRAQAPNATAPPPRSVTPPREPDRPLSQFGESPGQ